jgi:DNA modification methylase
MMVPARLAIALQEDGWYLRSDIIWHKLTAMPESCLDRPTSAHEHVFLLAKSERYFYDADAVREPLKPKTYTTFGTKHRPQGNDALGRVKSDNWGSTVGERQPRLAPDGSIAGANLRNVWPLASQPFPGSHFATMPPKLAERCILASTSSQACEHCNAPWQRETEQTGIIKMSGPVHPKTLASQDGTKPYGQSSAFRSGMVPTRETIGWQPTCRCKNNAGSGRCIVLDPFAGAGTSAYVAAKQGRDYLGIELNPEYVALAEKRLAELHPGLWGFSEKAAQ